jgi:hypothetical protein
LSFPCRDQEGGHRAGEVDDEFGVAGGGLEAALAFAVGIAQTVPML